MLANREAIIASPDTLEQILDEDKVGLPSKSATP